MRLGNRCFQVVSRKRRVLSRLLERIEVDVIIDFQGGGQQRNDLYRMIAAAVCDSAVAF